MKKNISLQELIAINNPSRAKKLIQKYGYKPARSYTDLIQKLKRLTLDNKNGLKELVEIHPHKDLFIHFLDLTSDSGEKAICPVCKEKENEKVNFDAKNDDYFINSSSSLNNNEDNQNYSYFSQLPMDESDKYMSSQSEKLNSSEIKKYIPLIAVTSIFTLILFTLIKRA